MLIDKNISLLEFVKMAGPEFKLQPYQEAMLDALQDEEIKELRVTFQGRSQCM